MLEAYIPFHIFCREYCVTGFCITLRWALHIMFEHAFYFLYKNKYFRLKIHLFKYKCIKTSFVVFQNFKNIILGQSRKSN